jgi:hypothetical protein
MRITLNDGRQMTGQMLAFDKVQCSTQCSFPSADSKAAHEPRSRRHRRISTGKTQANQRRAICSRQLLYTRARRNRRETNPGSHDRSRHTHRILFGRRSTSSGPFSTIRRKRTWRSWRRSSDISCWTRNKQTCWARTSCWIGWTGCWGWRASATGWIPRFSPWRFPRRCTTWLCRTRGTTRRWTT